MSKLGKQKKKCQLKILIFIFYLVSDIVCGRQIGVTREQFLRIYPKYELQNLVTEILSESCIFLSLVQ